MSSLIKQKSKVSSKAVVTIALCCTLALSMVLGALIVFALNQVSFNSSITVSFKAIDIEGSVTMYAKSAPKTENYTGTDLENKVGSYGFLASDSEKTTPAEINLDHVELTSVDNTLYLHYVFENKGSRTYTATLDFDETQIVTQQNTIINYSEEGTGVSYSSDNYAIVVPGEEIKHYYVKISVVDIALNADFMGKFRWRLNGIDDNTTSIEEKGINATTFRLISEEDNTYSAEYNGGDISLSGTTGGVSAQAASNAWHVPASIDLGTVISVVDGVNLPSNTEVYLAEGVEYIGDEAFADNTGLITMVMPNSIRGIMPSAFSGCSNLLLITMPSELYSIDAHAFEDCTSLIGVCDKNGELLKYGMYLSDNLEYLGDYAFSNCSSLFSVTIPSSITTIENGTFLKCSGLKNVVIGSGVSHIYDMAFCECNNLVSVTFEDPYGWEIRSFDAFHPLIGNVTADLSNIQEAATFLMSVDATCELYKF